jgi:ABC-2 type transport system permease protein
VTALFALTWIDVKLSLRNFLATFFTLAFPVLMLLLFGSMYGNAPSLMFGGYGSMDVSIPGYIAALVIGSTAFMSLPIELAGRREKGILRRFRASPLSPASVLASQVLANLLFSVLGTVLLLVAGSLAWHVRLPAHPLLLVPAFLLCCMSQYSLGFLIASLIRPVKTVLAVSMAVLYPMMFLSGGTIPLQFLPRVVQDISLFLPMTWTVRLLKDLWFDAGWNVTAVAVLSAVLVVCTLVSVRFFKWE